MRKTIASEVCKGCEKRFTLSTLKLFGLNGVWTKGTAWFCARCIARNKHGRRWIEVK